MKADDKKVIDQALRLPKSGRAALAAKLLASLDEGVDEDAEAAWAVEIERRARRALSGESKGIDRSVVHERIRSRLRRK